MRLLLSYLCSSLALGSVLCCGFAQAQVATDGNLSTTVSSADGRNFVIENGDRRGNNLFHSFREFSIPTGGSAFFNNSPDVQNIFGRVTGNSPSQINGLLRANGSANLFLLNPNGILFGENAQLNLGGSFIGSTASSIRFADGTEFSAVNPIRTNLLTISVPTGLQFGEQSGRIINRSQAPLAQSRFSGLQVATDRTLALIGSGIRFENGNVIAFGGRVELGSVAPGSLVTFTTPDFAMNYEQVEDFRDINLRRSLVDVSGPGGGDVQLQGRRIRFQNSSEVAATTFGDQPGGLLLFRASESLELFQTFTSTTTAITRGIASLVAPGATGQGSRVRIETPRLTFQKASVIVVTFGRGNAGDITIRADQFDILNPLNDAITSTFSGILSTTLSQEGGDGGNVRIVSDRIRLENGGLIATGTFGNGDAGNMTIRANQFEAIGTGYNGIQFSGIDTSLPTASASGQGGDLGLTVGQLRLIDGGTISASTSGSGNAGSVMINADSIDISGVAARPSAQTNRRFRSSITAASLPFSVLTPPNIPQNTPANTLRGSAGSVTINSDRLSVRDGGQISVSNLSRSGNAGNLNITANSVDLETGRLEARVRGGNQGNVNVNIDSGILQLRQRSRIITNAQGQATGGNINLNADFILASENSDISANSEGSFGGQVQINAESVFGTEFRPRLTSDSDITASSDRGAAFSGTVSLDTPGLDPGQGLTALPTTIVDASQQIENTCSAQGNRFVITGRGGIPDDPGTIISDRPWTDMRDLSAFADSTTTSLPAPVSTLQEADTWQVNRDGQVEFVVAGDRRRAIASPVTCAH